MAVDSEEDDESLTLVLQRVVEGDSNALEHLITAVHTQLRCIAAQLMKGESADHTLQPSALVNEAYLRLFGRLEPSKQSWANRRHFFGAAAETMRRILVDHARKKNSLKRGGGLQAEPINELHVLLNTDPEELLRVDEALASLAKEDELAAEIVHLRYFLGLTNAEIAELLDASRSTIYEHWSFARAWMIAYLDFADE